MLSISITADAVAWYGAIVATLGGVKVIYDIWNDKGRLNISFQRDMLYLGPNKEPQVVIRVINKSKRPTQLTHVGMRFYKDWDKATVFINELTRSLNEQSPATVYIHPQKDIDLSDLWFVYVIDARGKEHHLYLRKFGFLKWWQYSIRNKLIRRSLVNKKKSK